MIRILNAGLLAALLALGALGLQAAPAGAVTPYRGLLAGQLGYEGGAYPGGFHPTSGTVDVAFRSPPLVLVKSVGPNGRFAIPLNPGTYTVIGCGPSASGGTHQCSRPRTVTIRSGQIDLIRLVWALVP